MWGLPVGLIPVSAIGFIMFLSNQTIDVKNRLTIIVSKKDGFVKKLPG